MRNLCKLLVITCCLFQTVLAQDAPILENYNMDDGLPHVWVRSAVQDSCGFMWFATLKGLTRFDGYTFKTYDYLPKDSLGIDSDRILDLSLDDEGNIWIIRYLWPLERFNPNTEMIKRYTSRDYDLPTEDIEDIEYDPPNTIWLGHQAGRLSSLNKQTGEVGSFQLADDSSSIWDIHRDQDNELWIASSLGLYKFDSLSQTFTHYRFQDSINPNMYFDNLNDFEPGKLIMRTSIGLLVFDKDSEKFEVLVAYEYDTRHYVEGFTVKNGKDIWIGDPQGLIKYSTQHKSLTHYKLPPLIPLTIDRSSNIWIHGEDYGIFKFNPDRRKFKGFKPSSVNSDLSDNVTAVIEDHQGFIWVGTNDGLYQFRFSPEQKLELVQSFDKKTDPQQVTSILEDSRLNIWIGTTDGIYLLQSGSNRFKNIPA